MKFSHGRGKLLIRRFCFTWYDIFHWS